MEAERDFKRLERRLDTVRSVHQIVHALGAVARAQLQPVEAAVAGARAYVEGIETTCARLTGAPLERPDRPVLSVLIGPQRALCGTLANDVLAHARRVGPLGLVGRRLIDVAEEGKLSDRVVFGLDAARGVEDLEPACRILAEAVVAHGEGLQVELVHPGAERPRMVRAWLTAGAHVVGGSEARTYSPVEEVARRVLAETIEARLVLGLAEALRAEVRARLVVTENARRASLERRDAIAGALRRLRQEQVTTELLELVAGRAALI